MTALELNDKEVALGELDDLLDVECGLTDWELGLIESLHRQQCKGTKWTSKQIKKIHEIWDRLLG